MPVSPVNPLFPDMPDWQRKATDNLWPPYTQMRTTPIGLPVSEAEGVRIKLADGRTLIDGVSSWWSVCHGYRHPHIEQAVVNQLQKLPHIMLGGYQHEPAALLARRLADICPGELNHVFFTDSGSVAIEVAMKMAIQFWLNNGIKGRHKFMHFRGGYHGDTFATMAVCDPEEGMHSHFSGVLTPQILAELPINDELYERLDNQMATHADALAGLLIEPLVQGAGGMIFHSEDVLKKVADLCQKHDILLIADEIMTGLGRLGEMVACQRADVTPDIITFSKTLTGGTVPLAATIASRRIFEAFLDDDPAKALMHGPTFMGNPIGCAAALASLDLFEQEPRLDQVKAIETQLIKELESARELPAVKDVRVCGSIGVIETTGLGDVNLLKKRFVEEGVWIRPFGNIIYTIPPYIIGQKDLTQITSAMVKLSKEL
ncbi:Glutamate-ammonia-ligase adenylyltransferase protein [Candidatus Micropelagos thuwalensis]|uniref:Adenosylmethionine-8-amino-7-oxononanoate aminotransferase n=1 Tax=Candidatus Micropelagius thuwalensis TaxID=1397666 RepID=U2WVZ5_9PROT|nr:adenosylmethionine--8-amino-7-oxononanoate transaminase [Candidatus Micropelagos thuwalensis]ERL47693.1 Glutamate-ammonia-ligase adenylyltransferase protein [Candidatus Micropelagos thuwalensis]